MLVAVPQRGSQIGKPCGWPPQTVAAVLSGSSVTGPDCYCCCRANAGRLALDWRPARSAGRLGRAPRPAARSRSCGRTPRPVSGNAGA